MKLFEGSIKEFRMEVIENRIADTLASNFNKNGRRATPSEFRSWNVSLNFLKNALDYSELEENKLILEYFLPYKSERIDVLLFGKSIDTTENIVLIELKQWSNENVKDCETEGNVLVKYQKFEERAHPSLQIQGYSIDLTDFISTFEDKPDLILSSCSYCHNYSKIKDGVLYLPKFKKYLEKYPLFSKEDVKTLGEYLKDRLGSDPGFDVFNRFDRSPVKPSKKLLEHTSEMINKQQIFNLISDQITAYNAIMHRAKKLANSSKKSVIIVKGGPGTGKSVIALEVMGELMRNGKTVFHATGSSAFTNTLRKIVGKRAEKLFKFFFSFTKSKENELDVLICDEAHRIRENSNNYGVPFALISKNPQVEDLIKPAKLSIFFIDEYQVVRPTEIGSIELIKTSAKKLGVEESEILEYELKTQFRCSGSDYYLQWLENTLAVRESDAQFLTSKEMDFKIFDDPLKLKEAIEEKNRIKKNSARITAGFCWKWSKPNKDGSLVNDVVVGNLAMPWEKKDEFWKWATDETGMQQVGTVYTAQGFEFDYIGVIFGKDLVYDINKKTWMSKPENSYDNATKRNNALFTEHLKRVYRVLMSRAHKGCYVYFMDKGTEEYFRSRIKI